MRYFFIAHGSRHPAHKEAFDAFFDSLLSEKEASQYYHGFLDYCPPKAEQVCEELSHSDEAITFVPLFLGKASHYLEDVPELIQTFQVKNPNTDLFKSIALSDSQFLLQALEHELQQLLVTNKKDTSEVELILLGRGSSMKSSLEFIEQLKAGLTIDFKSIHVAYWDIAEPNIEDVLNRMIIDQTKHLVIQPLFLFPGKLYDQLNLKLKDTFKDKPQIFYQLGKTLSQWKQFPSLVRHCMQETQKA